MVLTESYHSGEFILSESSRTRSREQVTLVSGENLAAGAVLGQITIDTAGVTGAADAGNTGDGTIGTLSAGTGVQVGDYRAVCVEPATNGGTFSVEDPHGVQIGTAVVGTAFSGEVVFTISDGATDFVAGDAFTITVAAGSGKYKEYNPANTDGSQVPVAVLLEATDASAADTACVALVRDAEVKQELLQWFTGATANQKAAAIALLKNVGLIARSE